MTIRVSAGEVYERSLYRWIGAGVIFFGLLGLTISEKDWRGCVLLLAVVIAYAWYERKTQHDEELITINADHLQIEGKSWYRSDLKGFSLDYEINPVTQEQTPKVLFLYSHTTIQIYSFKGDSENVHKFIHQLETHIPYIKQIHLDWFKKTQRFLKI